MKNKIVILIFLLSVFCVLGALSYEHPVDPYGHPVKWRNSDIPVTYKIDDTGTPDCAGEFTAIQNAYQTWENSCSMNWTNGGTGSYVPADWAVNNGVNINVWCETLWNTVSGAGDGTIAICNYWYSYNTGNCWLTDTDIIYNGEDFTWSDSGEAGKEDVQNVATHETGHALVLSDLYDDPPGEHVEKTMYGYIVLGETKKRTLETDDINGARHLYPTPTATPTPTPTPTATAASGLQDWRGL